MSAAAAYYANLLAVQDAFKVIAALQLTAWFWPPQSSVQDGDTYDYIVVGAGSAGSVVAARLVEKGHSVLLMEAGGDPPVESMVPSLLSYLPKTKYDWNYTTTDSARCHKDNTMDLHSGRIVSGSNGFNFLLYVRGNPHDYQLWAEASNDTTWGYDEVLPFFKKSEDMTDPGILNSPNAIYHGTSGPLKITKYKASADLYDYFDAIAESGNNILIDYNGYDTLGYSSPMFTQDRGPRQSTAYAYLNPIKENPNLRLLKNTLATKIIFDEFKNAVAIECVTEGNKTLTVKARKEIILSAGALNSPKLLMLSGIGPKNHLQSMDVGVVADLPVGMNLQDHPTIVLLYQMEESDAPPPPAASDLTHTLPDNSITGFAAVNKCQSYPDYEVNSFLSPHDSTNSLQLCLYFGLQDDICQQLYNAGIGRNTIFTSLSLLQPKSRGSVLLKSKNPSDIPSIHPNYYSERSDLEKIVDSIEDFTKLSNTTYFKSVNASLLMLNLSGCEDFKFGSRDYWKCYAQCAVTAFYHYAGTCAMGSVLDSRLRVRHVNRLRVADASAIPIVTCGNINAPTIMIGEKAAAMIIEDHECNK